MALTPNSLQAKDTPARMHSGNTALSLPQTLVANDTYPIEFSGSGSEYFRIWVVNLLLILVTLGIYLPWAKVRKLKYFYGNTRIDGDALDFHGEAQKMLRGSLVAGVFFGVYSTAAAFSPWAGLVAGLAFVAIWPVLYRASLKFRLHNTSWRGIRLHLAPSSLSEVYWAVLPPNLLLIVPLALMGFQDGEMPLQGTSETLWTGMLVVFGGLFLLSLPYFLWRINRFRVAHSAWGPMRMEFRSDSKDMYIVAFKTLFMALLLLALFVAAALILVPGIFVAGKSLGWAGALAIIPLFIIFIVCMNILPRSYLGAHTQNLVWSRTGNRYMRFKSQLDSLPYMLLQLKNYVLIGITLGLYWPFAVVASTRMQIEAISLRTRIDLNTLTDTARRADTDAVGDMAADMFDMELGI